MFLLGFFSFPIFSGTLKVKTGKNEATFNFFKISNFIIINYFKMTLLVFHIEYGIVRECNEPSPIVSNLLIVNKKDGKSVRVLLDGRLLNIISKRLPQNLI